MISPARILVSSLTLSLLAFMTGCVETAVYERTASQLDHATRAGREKDQQVRALEWQVATLAQQVVQAEMRGAAAQRELHERLQKIAETNAACADRLGRQEAEAAQQAASVSAMQGARGRPEDLRRLLAAVEAQNARLIERLGRLEQKLDAQSGDVKALRQRGRPERTVDSEIIDPWGFGARK